MNGSSEITVRTMHNLLLEMAATQNGYYGYWAVDPAETTEMNTYLMLWMDHEKQ